MPLKEWKGENFSLKFMMVYLHFNPFNLILITMVIKSEEYTEIIFKVKEYVEEKVAEGQRSSIKKR